MTASLTTTAGTVRVTITSPTTYTFELNTEGSWATVATGRFGRLVIRTKNDERVEHTPSYTEASADADSILLHASWTDPDGVVWSFAQEFSLLPDSRQIRLVATATPAESRRVLHWSGPTLLAGDGTFGGHKTDAIFPGLEYLLEDEPSSSTAYAAPRFANRTVPHPYKVTIPLMAVSHNGSASASSGSRTRTTVPPGATPPPSSPPQTPSKAPRITSSVSSPPASPGSSRRTPWRPTARSAPARRRRFAWKPTSSPFPTPSRSTW